VRLGLLVLALLAFPAMAEVRLPEGAGKAIVEAQCTRCHRIDRVARAGYSADGWRNTVSMMKNVGAQLSPAETDTVVAYLARHFPQRAQPAPAIIPGDVQVSFREWFVPTAGSRPHDPLAARDGHLWYTGQFANQLGRLDPKTGELREYPLPVENSGPHGLTEDRDGNIWYTANFAGYIGRLDPKSGDVKLVPSPTPRSRPYGIQVDAKGVPWFAELGTNKVARIDPHALAITEYALPHADARPRRIAITKDGAIWYTDYDRGALGRFDPATGQVREWPSPSGRDSRPYGILADGGLVWYSESGVQPNTLVRFDPRAAKFQSWAIPSGGGVVRNMMLAPDGELALALSGVNGVALVGDRPFAPHAVGLRELRVIDERIVDRGADVRARHVAVVHARHALDMHRLVQIRAVVEHHVEDRDLVVRRRPQHAR
jgi:virginiamycin B lyase